MSSKLKAERMYSLEGMETGKAKLISTRSYCEHSSRCAHFNGRSATDIAIASGVVSDEGPTLSIMTERIVLHNDEHILRAIWLENGQVRNFLLDSVVLSSDSLLVFFSKSQF